MQNVSGLQMRPAILKTVRLSKFSMIAPLMLPSQHPLLLWVWERM